MSEARQERIRRILARTLADGPDRREAILAEECGDDTELREEVESLLHARERMGDFLETPAATWLHAAPPLEAGVRIGAYEVIRRIGAGGTGTVYEAIQARPRRRVALKVLGTGLESESSLARFQDEAEILARLKHPSIATVYEAGVEEWEGLALPWFALEYVEGARTVRDYAEATGLDTRRRLALVMDICGAIHHGHQKGIIHLDVKPGNVLVDESGRPKVIDFGIARVTDQGAADRGPLAGTLTYMSPEQCSPDRAEVDIRSDIYSLGVLTFEVLTGQVPLEVSGLSVPEAARRIREEPPTLLGRVDASLKGDIEAIVGRCLAKDREERYGSAAALSEDIGRHLTHHPVVAQSGGRLYSFRKFTRRRRGVFLAVLVVILVSIAAAIVSIRSAVRSERERRETEFQAYVANIAAATAALRVNDVAEARQRLDESPVALRGWEWFHLSRRIDTSVHAIHWPGAESIAGAVRGDGGFVVASGATGGSERFLRAWNGETGRILWTHSTGGVTCRALALLPDSASLAVGGDDGRILLRSTTTGETKRIITAHNEAVLALDISPDGLLMASGSWDGTARLWTLESGELRRTLVGHGDRIIDVAFDPTGNRVATGGRDGTVRIWDGLDGRCLAVLRGHEGSVEGVAWNPEGTRLASVSRDRTLRLWDTSSGRQLRVLLAHEENARDVSWSPDGRTVATASYDRTVRLWDVESGHRLAVFRGHTSGLKAVYFLDDGSRLVSVGRDGAIRFWDPATLGDVPTIRGNRDCVVGIALSPDGRHLASSTRDGTVRIRNLETRREFTAIDPEHARPVHLAFLRNGAEVGALRYSRSVRRWSVADGQCLGDLDRGYITSMALGPRRLRMYTTSAAGELLVHDLKSGARSGPRQLPASIVMSLAISPDGRRLAAGQRDGTLRLFRLPELTLLAETDAHPTRVAGLAFDPSGGRLATACWDGEVRVFEARSLEQLLTLTDHTARVHAVVFSPDGSRLASASDDGTVRLWDLDRGRQVAVLFGHGHPVRCLAFSPDGTRLASGGGYWEGRDSAVKLWEITPP